MQRGVRTTLAGALLVVLTAAPSPAWAYGGTTTLSYGGQLTGYAASWRNWWDPYGGWECTWWEYDWYWGQYYCLAWVEWENLVRTHDSLHTPSDVPVFYGNATDWDHAQVNLPAITPTEYGTWTHHAIHAVLQRGWTFDGWQWHYWESEWAFDGSAAQVHVPWPPPSISWIAPTSGPVSTVIDVHGQHFRVPGALRVNGIDASILQWTPTFIRAAVHANTPLGPGAVQVVTDLQQWSNANHTFTVTVPAPPPGELFYYHSDAVGSVRLITNASGQVVKPYDYTAYGQPFPGDLDPETRRFGQLERTVETGNQSSWEPLDYAMARYYHSQTGRFISPDSWAYADPLNPQSWNLYAYALNNPLRYVDPLGTCVETATNLCVNAPDPERIERERRERELAEAARRFFWESMWNQHRSAASAALGAIPGVGTAQSFGELVTGHDYIGGHPTSRLVAAGGILAGAVPGGKTLLRGAGRGATTTSARGVSVLGHASDGYVSVAQTLGARYFNVPAKVWDAMTPAQQWAANTKFLDRLIARGDTVVLATQASAARAGSFFARELEYLSARGYTLAEDGLRMLPPRP